MATKQIYISDEDESVFENAKRVSGGLNNSQLVLSALREFIASRETDKQEIVIKIGDETMKFLGKKI